MDWTDCGVRCAQAQHMQLQLSQASQQQQQQKQQSQYAQQHPQHEAPQQHLPQQSQQQQQLHPSVQQPLPYWQSQLQGAQLAEQQEGFRQHLQQQRGCTGGKEDEVAAPHSFAHGCPLGTPRGSSEAITIPGWPLTAAARADLLSKSPVRPQVMHPALSQQTWLPTRADDLAAAKYRTCSPCHQSTSGPCCDVCRPQLILTDILVLGHSLAALVLQAQHSPPCFHSLSWNGVRQNHKDSATPTPTPEDTYSRSDACTLCVLSVSCTVSTGYSVLSARG